MEYQIPCVCIRFSRSCLRVSLVITSIFLWIQGVCFLLLGVFIHNFLKHFFTSERGLKEAGGFPIASIFLGITMILVTYLINYFVVYPTRNRYFMVSLLLVCLFAFELLTFISSLGYAHTIERVLKQGYEIAMINYADGFITNTELNLMQYILNCCGAIDFKDWYNTSWGQGRMQVPESCCLDLKKCHNLEPVMTDDIYLMGCNEKITNVIKSHNIGLIFVITCGALTQFLGVILCVSLGIKDMEKSVVSADMPLV